ncbi:MAG: hypothetical protein ACRDLF_00585 [Solirubrobacteraceae bacterium]
MNVLSAVVNRPGALAADHGQTNQIAPRLRWLRESGLVHRDGATPARWYPTRAGAEEIDRRRLALLRQKDRQRRLRALDAIRRAEALFAFADSLGAPATPALCATGGQRRMTFGDLVALLGRSVGRNVLVATDAPKTTWPPVSPIIAVGEIGFIEQERERDVGDWRLNLSLDDCAFVEFSRRRFERATLDLAMDEIHVHQAGQKTVLCFEE